MGRGCKEEATSGRQGEASGPDSLPEGAKVPGCRLAAESLLTYLRGPGHRWEPGCLGRPVVSASYRPPGEVTGPGVFGDTCILRGVHSSVPICRGVGAQPGPCAPPGQEAGSSYCLALTLLPPVPCSVKTGQSKGLLPGEQAPGGPGTWRGPEGSRRVAEQLLRELGNPRQRLLCVRRSQGRQEAQTHCPAATGGNGTDMEWPGMQSCPQMQRGPGKDTGAHGHRGACPDHTEAEPELPLWPPPPVHRSPVTQNSALWVKIQLPSQHRGMLCGNCYNGTFSVSPLSAPTASASACFVCGFTNNTHRETALGRVRPL